jgi:hypothetical protein
MVGDPHTHILPQSKTPSHLSHLKIYIAMNKISTPFKVFIALIVCYGFFQYGRVHDDGYKVYQPEYNHAVYSDRVDIVMDTLGNPYSVIWRDPTGKEHSFTYCVDCLENR